MIRHANLEDFEDILKMGRKFWRLTGYVEDPYDVDQAKDILDLASSHGMLMVLELEGKVKGFVAAIAAPLLVTKRVTQATEVAYWVDEDARGHGSELLDGLERAVRASGAKYLNMIAIHAHFPERAAKVYLRKGYRIVETVYQKEL